MRKKLDPRLTALLSRCLKTGQRTLLVLVGDRARYQVVNLHYLLVKEKMKSRPRVLWCYKKELGFSSHQKKRMKEIKHLQKKGVYQQDMDDPFELFISQGDIQYCYYKESHKVLGQTFQMLILQDFEALTPNLLCRTIETVEGGGIIVLMLKTMTSLKQLYTLSMDVHKRYRTEQFSNVEPRFNERFILSLANNPNALLMDDQLNLLPISSSEAVPSGLLQQKSNQELQKLKDSFKAQETVGQLVQMARTLDQAKALLAFVDCLTKPEHSIVSITAPRGRGKSACVGLSIAAAIRHGHSNIFLTAPSPINLATVFEFISAGLQAFGYRQHSDFDLVESNYDAFNRAVIRLNVTKNHHQAVQYVLPHDSAKISNADLVVIDQAAAIPLPLVKGFIGDHKLLISSTVNGYEGTGRSLSIKLFNQLKESARKASGMPYQEVQMQDPIRYALNDPVQAWLNSLLLLEATTAPQLKGQLPHPEDCQLFLINKDTLFSHQKTTERFLFNMMSLFISSHYKNSPNDLQLLSDAASHLIFVLLGPMTTGGGLPDILAAVELSLEGNLSVEGIAAVQRGLKPSGDLIPWNIRQQFLDHQFPQLAGGRVVRIAVHPAAQRMGYGLRTLQLLHDFCEGKLRSLGDEELSEFHLRDRKDEKPSSLKPLLKRVSEVKPLPLSYLGVCYGVSLQLYKFWRKAGYEPVYIRQSVNDLTAEHSCIMINPLLQSSESRIDVSVYTNQFRKRFSNLLAYDFRDLDIQLALQILRPDLTTDEGLSSPAQLTSVETQLTYSDIKRLQAYSKNHVDFHLVIDLLPRLAHLYYQKVLGLKLSYSQAAILAGMGFQKLKLEQVVKQVNIEVNQGMALLNKLVKKITGIVKKAFQGQIQMPKDTRLDVDRGLGRDLQLEGEGQQAIQQLYQLKREGPALDSQPNPKKRHLPK